MQTKEGYRTTIPHQAYAIDLVVAAHLSNSLANILTPNIKRNGDRGLPCLDLSVGESNYGDSH